MLLPWRACASYLDERRRTATLNQYDTMLDDVRQRLQGGLGPSEPIADSLVMKYVNYACFLRFHPRQALRSVMIQRAEDVTREAADLMKEANRLQ